MGYLAYSTSANDAAVLAALALIYGVLFIVAIIGYVIGAFFLMKVFDKAGVQGRWRAWVPVYNSLIFAKLGDLSPWWLLILWGGTIVLGWIPVIGSLVAIAAGVYLVLAAYRVQVKLGKEWPWLLLYIFLSLIWHGILAFDRSRWSLQVQPAPWANTFLVDKTVWNGVPAQTPTGGYAVPGAPGAYPPPAGYEAPPPGYSAPPATTPPPAAAPQPPAAPPAPPTNQPPAPPSTPPAPPEQ